MNVNTTMSTTTITAANGTPRSELRIATAATMAAATSTRRTTTPVSAPTSRPAAREQDAPGVGGNCDYREYPTHNGVEERRRQVGDEARRQVDGAGIAEHKQQRPLPAEQAGEGDDERRDSEGGDHEPVEEPDRHPDRERGHDSKDRRPAVLDTEDRHHAGCQAADGADREVDLAE